MRPAQGDRFLGVLVALQTVIMGLEEVHDFRMADEVALFFQLLFQGAQTLVRPLEQGFRVSLGAILNQPKQIILYRRVGFRDSLAAPAGLSVSIFGEHYSGIKFSNPSANGWQ